MIKMHSRAFFHEIQFPSNYTTSGKAENSQDATSESRGIVMPAFFDPALHV